MSGRAVCVVIAPLPIRFKKGREVVEEQRRHARRALFHAARLAGADIAVLAQDDRGAPLPSNGWYWSLSHCASMVAGCVHRAPVGVDVEDRRDVRAEVIERVLNPSELALFERRGEAGFLRAWTAKEALLKEIGLGIAGLARCVIVEVLGDDGLILDFDGQRRRVWQNVKRDCVVAISSADGAAVDGAELRDPLKICDGEREPWS